ncbi:MAG: acyl-CoA dehydrogenase [Chloroflexi bacterium]|nr:MAG: acyl-CoA dehydrogenase [Chloroflexota bacterium]
MISFTPSEEQQMVVDAVHAFAEEQMRPAAHEADESGLPPEEIIQTGWEIGLLPGAIPEELGGFGEHSAVTGVLAAEELAWGDLSLALHIMTPALFALPILLCGTEDQQARYLPDVCTDRFPSLTAAVIEPAIRYDPRRPATTATPDAAGSWVLDGRKTYVPLAAEAERILVFAGDSETGQVHGFVVDRDANGVAIGERNRLMGLRALPTYDVTLSDVVVGVERRLGGEAGTDFQRILNHFWVASAALAVGVARGAYEYARDYAKERVQFGKPIAQKQAIAFLLAEMAIEVDATRLMVWEAAWKLDRRQDATREAYLARQYAQDMVLFVTDSAVQVLGGHGYIRDHPVERWLRNGRGFATFDGLAIV